MINLNNKIIVVTGGSGLLGNAILNEIIQSGGTAINIDINIKTNLKTHTFKCDITNSKKLESVIHMILNKYGKIDGWVNNAYPRTTDWDQDFEKISINSWKKNIDIQLNSVFSCCQKVLIEMKKQGFGSIVNIGSIYGIVGPNFDIYESTKFTMPAAYSAIKGGVITFTKYLASYYGKYNIRVNCVSPGGIFNNQSEKFVKQYESLVPLKKMAKANQISPAIVFLLSDSAEYITGHNLVVDGGWTIV
jgi:NAD(P)-dependent dehydrogenase (short-subunit alcohol dehydrogenase family)